VGSYCGELIVSGFVYGHNKQSLSGATIDLYFKGRSVYTIVSDAKGYFHFAGLSKGDSLVFTYVGYSVGTYVVKGSAYVEVGLKREAFTPAKISYTNYIVFQSKHLINYQLYVDKSTNDKAAFVDLYHPDRRFMKVEIGPAYNVSSHELDSTLSSLIAKEKLTRKRDGIVKIGITVDKNGNVIETQIIQSFQVEVDEKIKRYFSSDSKWVPALQNGQKVYTYFELSFNVETKSKKLTLNVNNS